MNKLARNILYAVLMPLALMAFSSCSQEDELLSLPNGKLHFAIGQVTTETETRATPSEIGKPVAEKFNLKVQRVQSDYVAYKGPFVESVEVRVGDYDITATCGEDVLIGRDTPYYIGTVRTTIEENKSASVVIPCRVGNALVSVRFGVDEAEVQRFSRFYEDYGLLVKNGDYSLSIGKEETATSIYFPAGTSPELIFYGTLKQESGRVVSTTLTHESLPTVFNAADHAIITVSLPDPESAIAVNINKVEVVEAKLDETIPLSWLPVPSVNPNHMFNDRGVLMGTNLEFSNSYPEMRWEARVSNAKGDTVRRILGTGALVSEYTSSEEWPYLQKGKYKATYFLHTEEGVSKVSSREFNVGSPQIAINITGYTSYDKYIEGDIEGANASDGHTLYDPQISVGIAPALIKMDKYGYRLTYSFNGEELTSTENNTLLGAKELNASLEAYTLVANVQFADEEASQQRKFFITGVPFLSEPPTTSTWEKFGDVTDDGDYARLGRWSSGNQSLTYKKVAIPAGTNLALDYKFKPNAGAVSTTFTIHAGNQELISGKAGAYENPTFEGTQDVTLSESVVAIRCNNSYGAGNTGTDLYRVGMKYRQ